ncbi:TetR/AcrR family transcriptional regulator [Paenibacillus puldeungensis]|uniref:TetR/AcrR family transcriptional regulator n=1 Tax=Paenibacillus puldeungensis TaxID=696536 RepID=A0ABW3RVP0_9BACL
MTPRTKEQNEEIRIRRLAQIRIAAADVFLDKGLVMEIRDVAVQAGLGYGTVYHYYSNKGDLLHDLLWVCMERAGEWLDGFTSPSPSVTERLSDLSHDRRMRQVPLAEEKSLFAAGIRLLEAWADDHGLYLLYKLAADDFRPLPEARAVPLAAAFREQVLLPFAAVLGDGELVPAKPSALDLSENSAALRFAEFRLAALAGAASLPLRRGTLRADARDIAAVLFTERTMQRQI